MNARFESLFERPVQVFPLCSGTGSNSIALAALANPYGAIYCHETAHINVYECGAPEFFTGAKARGPAGRDYKLEPAALEEALALAGRGNPTASSPSPSTSRSPPTSARSIRRPRSRHSARSRTATASRCTWTARASPTPWRHSAALRGPHLARRRGRALARRHQERRDQRRGDRGLDPALAREIPFLMKRGGQVLSKARFVSAQLERYVADERWLERAAAAKRPRQHARPRTHRAAWRVAGRTGRDQHAVPAPARGRRGRARPRAVRFLQARARTCDSCAATTRSRPASRHCSTAFALPSRVAAAGVAS